MSLFGSHTESPLALLSNLGDISSNEWNYIYGFIAAALGIFLGLVLGNVIVGLLIEAWVSDTRKTKDIMDRADRAIKKSKELY